MEFAPNLVTFREKKFGYLTRKKKQKRENFKDWREILFLTIFFVLWVFWKSASYISRVIQTLQRINFPLCWNYLGCMKHLPAESLPIVSSQVTIALIKGAAEAAEEEAHFRAAGAAVEVIGQCHHSGVRDDPIMQRPPSFFSSSFCYKNNFFFFLEWWRGTAPRGCTVLSYFLSSSHLLDWCCTKLMRVNNLDHLLWSVVLSISHFVPFRSFYSEFAQTFENLKAWIYRIRQKRSINQQLKSADL